jgi:hypothetical protein
VANDNSNKGLGSPNMDEDTKFEIQSKGGQASHGGGRQSGSDSGQSQDSGQNQGSQSQGNQGDDSSGTRGLGAMEEEGRDEEVSEIASLGGQASRGGGRSQEE